MDELVHVITHFAQPVKFVPSYGEEEARGVVLFAGIFQVSCLRQDFQCAVHRDGKILEFAAEVFDVEFAYAVQAVSHCHLVVVLKVLVHVFDIFFFRKCIRYALVQRGLVCLGI